MENSNLQFEDDGFEIKIQVVNPELKSQLGGASKHYIYRVKGQDKLGQFESIRRYSDFDIVRSTLLSRWPGFFIASIPEKKIIGNNEAVFVQNRRRGLQDFLITVSTIKHLWYSEEMQLFLKSKQQIEKPIKSLANVNIKELVERYEINFKKFDSVSVTSDMIAKVLQFSIFLNQVTPIIDNLIEMSQNMQIVRKKHSEKYTNILQKLFPQYEKNCLKEYIGQEKNKLIFCNQTENNLTEIIGKIKENNSENQQALVTEGLKRQRRQINSFLQTIKVRDQFQANKQKSVGKVKDLQLENQKIQSGKSSLFSKIRKLTQEQQLKINGEELEVARLQQQNYTYICNMMNIIINLIEMEKFKKLRQKAYYTLLKKVCVYQKQSDKILNQFWTKILSYDALSKYQ